MITFNELLEIVEDPTRTAYQKAADLHAMLVSDQTVPARAAEPVKARKPRGPNKPKLTSTTPQNVFQDQ